MQVVAYDGYFDNGNFYASGKIIRLPERRRVVITILDESQSTETESEDARKREVLRSLRGSCKDPSMVEPTEIPLENDIPRRYDLI